MHAGTQTPCVGRTQGLIRVQLHCASAVTQLLQPVLTGHAGHIGDVMPCSGRLPAVIMPVFTCSELPADNSQDSCSKQPCKLHSTLCHN